MDSEPSVESVFSLAAASVSRVVPSVSPAGISIGFSHSPSSRLESAWVQLSPDVLSVDVLP